MSQFNGPCLEILSRMMKIDYAAEILGKPVGEVARMSLGQLIAQLRATDSGETTADYFTGLLRAQRRVVGDYSLREAGRYRPGKN
jgi:hypothetical protein